MSKIKVYLDIDGVLLANELHPALHAKEFILYVVENYDVYWLTTHCQGDTRHTLNHLSGLFDDETLRALEEVKPTKWGIAKTEAIDFSSPFLWFDDDLYPEEKEALLEHDALGNWVEVDLAKDNDQLGSFLRKFPQPVTYSSTRVPSSR